MIWKALACEGSQDPPQSPGGCQLQGLRQTGKDGSVVNGQRVLVVDGMHEVQEVLHAVLAPRGLRVDWIRGQQFSSGTADQPDIVVIDAEALPVEQNPGSRPWSHVPQVILGSTDEETPTVDDAQHAYLSKPFQYPDLIQAIERLLPMKSA